MRRPEPRVIEIRIAKGLLVLTQAELLRALPPGLLALGKTALRARRFEVRDHGARPGAEACRR